MLRPIREPDYCTVLLTLYNRIVGIVGVYLATGKADDDLSRNSVISTSRDRA